MMRTPRGRDHDPTVELPACQNYASLTDMVFVRRPRRLASVVLGACAAALVVTAGVELTLHPTTPTPVAIAPVPAAVAPAPAAVAPAPAAATPARATVAPARATVAPARFQVAGVSIAVRRDPAATGVQRIVISPASGSRADAVGVERAVLRNLITGPSRAPRLTTVRFDHRSATQAHYLGHGGVPMTALCVQWTARTAYLLTAPTGAGFARLRKEFRPT